MGLVQREALLSAQQRTPAFRASEGTGLLEELWHQLSEPRRIDGCDGLDELSADGRGRRSARKKGNKEKNDKQRKTNKVVSLSLK